MSKLNDKCCNSEHLKYNDTLISCELEHWYCTVCNRDFEVDLEMKRDFKNKRSLKILKISQILNQNYKQKRRK